MAVNDWTVGNLYPSPGGIGGFWKQPIPGGLVYPQQVTANSDQLKIEPYCELTGQFMGSCGHSFNMCYVFREYDYTTNSSVALLCCSSCGCIQRTISPFEDALMGNSGALLNSVLFP
jgi:hypothetical protein